MMTVKDDGVRGGEAETGRMQSPTEERGGASRRARTRGRASGEERGAQGCVRAAYVRKNATSWHPALLIGGVLQKPLFGSRGISRLRNGIRDTFLSLLLSGQRK